VNIIAFQSIPLEKTILVCIVVDEQGAARAALDTERITYSEGEVVQVQLPHGPGELALAATKLGDANINIQYAYCGVEPIEGQARRWRTHTLISYCRTLAGTIPGITSTLLPSERSDGNLAGGAPLGIAS
jgi:hypothetical protein